MTRPLTVAALAVLITLPSLWVGIATDDHVFRMVFQGHPGIPELDVPVLDTFTFGSGDIEQNRIRKDRGLLPWWVQDDWRMSFWRPVSSLSHWVEFRLFGDRTWIMHLSSLLMYGAMAAAVCVLYRRMMPATWVAGLAALLFVLDDAHGLPVGWLSNRNALLAALFGVLALIAHDRARRDKWRPGLPLALLCLACGLLSGESAVSVGGYLFAYAVFIDRAPLSKKVLSLLPYLGVVIIWRACYNYLGYGVTGAGLYVDPMANPLTFAANALCYFPLLLFGLFSQVEPGLTWLLLSGPWEYAASGGALCLLAAVAWIMWPKLRNDRVAHFWLVGMAVSAVPLCSVIPQGRLLLLPGIGAMALMAQFISAVREKLHDKNVRDRVARTFAGLLIVLHLILAPPLLAFSSYSVALLEKASRQLNDSAPSDAAIESQTLIIVNTVADVAGMGLPIMRSSMGETVPRNTWNLAAGESSVQVERIDARTIVVRPDGGFLTRPNSQVFRNPATSPINKGEEFQLTGLKVTVLSVSQDGRPLAVQFRFDNPLEDPRYRWITLEGGGYVSYMPPEIGDSNSVPGGDFGTVLKAALAGD